MQKTPMSLRKHVSIFGEVNAGKSTLFNSLLGQDAAIVSSQAGTTTDPVIKAMELLPFGPIALVDTAGFSDHSEIGEKRIQRTNQILGRTDLAIYVIDINLFRQNRYEEMILFYKKKSIPYIVVFTKCDQASMETRLYYQKKYRDAIFMSYSCEKEAIISLKKKMVEKLQKQEVEEERVIGDLLEEESLVIMVVPIDSAAPKGRLILPQVQFIRECLDHGMKCLVTRETELAKTLEEVNRVDLVVTDSQAFKVVSEIVPKEIPLTSFSMLLARQKGDIDLFIEGIKQIDVLENNGKILIAEACTHNDTHEDIGRVKLPALMKSYTGKELQFDYSVGYDFPENLEEYDMVIHCGGCMINKKAIKNRMEICRERNIPMTNYGVILAYLNGILPRCIEIFEKSRRTIG